MKNLKSKLNLLFWDYEETATYFDKINLVCSFKEHIDNMDDLELAEKLEIDADNNGLIAITSNAIKETRRWEEGRITLDFDKKIVKFNVYFKRAAKEYYKDEYYKNRTIHAELLRSPFYMTFDYFIDDFCKQNFENFCFKYKNLIIEPIY